MDEIDQCTKDQGPHPTARYDPYNRPIPSNDQESFDEVDRPSTTMQPNTPRSEPDLNISSEDEKVGSEGNEFQLNGISVEEKDSNESDFEIVDTPPIIGREPVYHEGTDGPAVQTVSADAPLVSNTDGPFSQMFKKPGPLIQPRMERTDKEGIVTKFTTFYPKQPNVKHDGGNKTQASYSDSCYSMDTFPRGKLTLINVKFFTRSSGMADYPRHGTDKDADGLCSLFLDLGFIVDRYDNPSKKDIATILKGAANEDYSAMSCCACAMLSHGEEGIIYGTDGFVKIKEITKLFRTRSLAGKPKFFLFQACQGSEYMDPIDSVDGPAQRRNDDDMALTLPSEADFIYAYSTVPGYYSWRNSRKGSWFMESVVSVFRENAHKMDVLRMLTRVNATVAYRKSRTDDYKTDDKRQIASIITQTRKDFFLFPPYGPLQVQP